MCINLSKLKATVPVHEWVSLQFSNSGKIRHMSRLSIGPLIDGLVSLADTLPPNKTQVRSGEGR